MTDSRLNRIQTKELIEQQLTESPLWFAPTLWVITSSSSSKHPLHSIPVANREKRDQGKWYFIVVYFTHSFNHRIIGCIHHDTLAVINASNKNDWIIPFRLCQMPERITPELNFTFYQAQFDPYSSRVTPQKLLTAFQLRVKLYRWFAMPEDFQDSHPLNELEAQYAGVGSNDKILDTVVYTALSHMVDDVPNARDHWLKGETALLRHKLLLRPDLCAQFEAAVGCDLMGAIEAIPAFHEAHQLKVKATHHSFFFDRSLVKLVASTLREILLDKVIPEPDEELQHMVNPPKRVQPPQPIDSFTWPDIVGCSPKCLQQKVKQLRDPETQSKMIPTDRVHVNRFLLENGFDVQQIVALSQPKVVIAYEMDDPILPLTKVERLVVLTDQHRNKEIVESEEHFRSCFDMMNLQLCPFKHKPTPSYWTLSDEGKKTANKARFVHAKRLCHADMKDKWEKRKSTNDSGGEKVKDAWVLSPYVFAQVVFKGEKFNLDKKAEQKRKQQKRRLDAAKKPPIIEEKPDEEFKDEDSV